MSESSQPAPPVAPAVSPVPVVASMSAFWPSTARVLELSIGQMLWSRRTVFMALVVGVPVVVSLVVRILFEAGLPVTHMGRTAVTGPVVFGLMIWGFFIRFSIPVLAVFYGTSLIADEVEDKTLTYLFVRPVPRGAVLLGKYAAYLAVTISVILPAVVLVWLLIAPIGASLGETFSALPKDLGILAAGLAAYGAVFALAGVALRRPLLFGLLFVFGYENLILLLPGYLKQFTVAHYLQGLVPHALPVDSTLGALQAAVLRLPGLSESLAGLAVITAVALWLAARTVTIREYVLEQ